MRKSFSIPAPASTGPVDRELDLNGEIFILADDIEGMEMLKLTGGATSGSAGVHALLSRVIKDDDWDRFGKTTAHFKLQDFFKVAGGVIDIYAENPITAVAAS